MSSLSSLMSLAQEVVRSASELIRSSIEQSDKAVDFKTNRHDVVTQTDKAVEAFIIDAIKSKHPDHAFIGEESSSCEESEYAVDSFDSRPTWIIDPIDGTLNFVHSNPHVSISLALAIDRRVHLAIVYLPIMDEMYTATRGKGAFLNDRPIRVSECRELREALVIQGLWTGLDKERQMAIRSTLDTLMSKAHAIRSFGSAAINLAYVAAGRADCYSQKAIHVWDVAAGALIVKEAGGVVLNTDGDDFDLMNGNVLAAATTSLAKDMVDNFTFFKDNKRDFKDVCPL